MLSRGLRGRQFKRESIPPRDGDGLIHQFQSQNDRQIRSLMESDPHSFFDDPDVGRNVDDVLKKVPRVGVAIASHPKDNNFFFSTLANLIYS